MSQWSKCLGRTPGWSTIDCSRNKSTRAVCLQFTVHEIHPSVKLFGQNRLAETMILYGCTLWAGSWDCWFSCWCLQGWGLPTLAVSGQRWRTRNVSQGKQLQEQENTYDFFVHVIIVSHVSWTRRSTWPGALPTIFRIHLQGHQQNWLM